MCIERILEKLYNSENLYHYFLKKEKEKYHYFFKKEKEKINFFKDIRLYEIKKYINKINHETTKNNYKDDNKKNKQEKNTINNNNIHF